jgi:hypothetical protein
MTHVRYIIDQKQKFGYFLRVVNAAAVLACDSGNQQSSLANEVLREA